MKTRYLVSPLGVYFCVTPHPAARPLALVSIPIFAAGFVCATSLCLSYLGRTSMFCGDRVLSKKCCQNNLSIQINSCCAYFIVTYIPQAPSSSPPRPHARTPPRPHAPHAWTSSPTLPWPPSPHPHPTPPQPQDFAAKNFCENQIQMQFYPTFMFFGAGKFHDHDPLSGVVLGPRPTVHDSTALVSELRLGGCGSTHPQPTPRKAVPSSRSGLLLMPNVTNGMVLLCSQNVASASAQQESVGVCDAACAVNVNTAMCAI